MTDKTVNSLYQTLYLENRILKIQRNNEKTSRVYVKKDDVGRSRKRISENERRKHGPQRYAGSVKKEVKLKRAQGGCLGTESRRKT